MRPERLAELQQAIRAEGVDGWLFCDFRGSDPIGRRILGLGADELATRRWFYAIPADGPTRKLVSAVEPRALDELPGTTSVYRTWQELHGGLRTLLAGQKHVAMQYSPANAVPYVARVDAGTIELIRSFGVEVCSAADLIQRCEAVWTAVQFASHQRAAQAVGDIVGAAFREIGRRYAQAQPCSELLMQAFIMEQFSARGLTASHPPIVAVGAHSADPHFRAATAGDSAIGAGDFVLIDLWAKEPDGVYADITWTGFVGASVPERPAAIFEIVRRARDAGVEALREAMREGRSIRGADVDGVVRGVIKEAGYGEHFIHRTGHSIGTEVHGNGANIDGFETPDERRLLPHTCFSIEPGIYLPGELGVRSELNVYLDGTDVVVTGPPVQNTVVPILGGL